MGNDCRRIDRGGVSVGEVIGLHHGVGKVRQAVNIFVDGTEGVKGDPHSGKEHLVVSIQNSVRESLKVQGF